MRSFKLCPKSMGISDVVLHRPVEKGLNHVGAVFRVRRRKRANFHNPHTHTHPPLPNARAGHLLLTVYE